MTPRELRRREDLILDALENTAGDTTFLRKLHRDGVPTPPSYLAQRVRVLFVFREPNSGGKQHAHDMRSEVSDPTFRPLWDDGTRHERSIRCWWNWKAGMFAHAVSAALDAESVTKAFRRFLRGGWNHEVVNRHAYIQIKKLGGRGASNADEIADFASRYASTLRQQVELYRPHLIIGGGVGKDSPSQLLAAHVVQGGDKRLTIASGATWWKFRARAFPRAMIQAWHPARRGSKRELYRDVWSSVSEVAEHLGMS